MQKLETMEDRASKNQLLSGVPQKSHLGIYRRISSKNTYNGVQLPQCRWHEAFTTGT